VTDAVTWLTGVSGIAPAYVAGRAATRSCLSLIANALPWSDIDQALIDL
jgi:hypothetical protein